MWLRMILKKYLKIKMNFVEVFDPITGEWAVYDPVSKGIFVSSERGSKHSLSLSSDSETIPPPPPPPTTYVESDSEPLPPPSPPPSRDSSPPLSPPPAQDDSASIYRGRRRQKKGKSASRYKSKKLLFMSSSDGGSVSSAEPPPVDEKYSGVALSDFLKDRQLQPISEANVDPQTLLHRRVALEEEKSLPMVTSDSISGTPESQSSFYRTMGSESDITNRRKDKVALGQLKRVPVESNRYDSDIFRMSDERTSLSKSPTIHPISGPFYPAPPRPQLQKATSGSLRLTGLKKKKNHKVYRTVSIPGDREFSFSETIASDNGRVNNLRKSKVGRSLLEYEIEDEPDTIDNLLNDPEFSLAVHRHGWVARSFKLGGRIDQRKLLSWKKTPIKKALLKHSSKNDKLAIECFKLIQEVMGDRDVRISKEQAIVDIMEIVLRSDDSSMKDELFMQILKQVHGNPDNESERYGWRLMIVCLSCFSPSKKMSDYISGVLDDDMITIKETCRVIGDRKSIPTIQEVSWSIAEKHTTIKLDVCGEIQTVEIGLLTTIDVLLEKVVTAMELQKQLYGVYDNQNRLMTGEKKRVVDILSYSDLKVKISLLVVSGFSGRDLDFMHKRALVEWKTLKFFMPKNWHAIIAALVFHVQNGDFDPRYTKKWIEDRIWGIVPPLHDMNRRKMTAFIEKVQDEYKLLALVPRVEAQSRVIEILDHSSHGVYGNTFFEGLWGEEREMVRLGVSHRGVILMWPTSLEIIEEFTFDRIVGWINDGHFILVIGSLSNPTRIPFATTHSETIATLLEGYKTHNKS